MLHIYSLFYFHSFLAVRAHHTCPLFFSPSSCPCCFSSPRTRTQYTVHVLTALYPHTSLEVRARSPLSSYFLGSKSSEPFIFFLLLLLLPVPFFQSARVRVRVRSTRTQYPVRVLTALYPLTLLVYELRGCYFFSPSSSPSGVFFPVRVRVRSTRTQYANC